jgi:ribosomal protein L7/L12
MRIEAFGYILTLEKDEAPKKMEQAEWIRHKFRMGLLDKIQAIKEIRQLFLDTEFPLRGLKEAKDFVEAL